MSSEQPCSQLFMTLAEACPPDRVQVENIVEALDQRSFGVILLLLAGLGIIPGVSFAAGFAIFLLAIQIMRGQHAPILPTFLTRRSISSPQFVNALHRLSGFLTHVERFIKPRIEVAQADWMHRIVGLLIALLAVFMVTPLPLSNVLPALVIILIALGMLEEDGLLILAGAVIGVSILLALSVVFKAVAGWF